MPVRLCSGVPVRLCSAVPVTLTGLHVQVLGGVGR